MPRWLPVIQEAFPVTYEQLHIKYRTTPCLYQFCKTAEPSADASFYHIAQSDLFTVTAANNTGGTHEFNQDETNKKR